MINGQSCRQERITPDELLMLPEEDHFELIDGQMIERNPGMLSSWIGGNLFCLIASHCDAHRLGWTMPVGVGYCCFPHSPHTVRRSPASFIRFERLARDQLPSGYVEIPPDLVVEVLCPTDRAYAVDRKIEDYQKVGVRLVWVINPNGRSVRVHRADGTETPLRQADELTGEDVLPGFRCRVGDLFPTPPNPPPSP